VWTVYAASKTLAERAAWDFVAKEKPAFDLTAINPSFNFGPYLHEVRAYIGRSSGGFNQRPCHSSGPQR